MATSRRARAVGGRPHQITVWLSDAELGAVVAAAARAGMAPGAWLGNAGVRAAEAGAPQSRVTPGLAALAPLCSELMEHRRVLRNVGGNLNDVARHANSTGVLHPNTERVEQLVARVVERVDLAVGQVESLARETRAERVRAGRLRAGGGRGRAGTGGHGGGHSGADSEGGGGRGHDQRDDQDGRGHQDGRGDQDGRGHGGGHR